MPVNDEITVTLTYAELEAAYKGLHFAKVATKWDAAARATVHSAMCKIVLAAYKAGHVPLPGITTGE